MVVPIHLSFSPCGRRWLVGVLSVLQYTVTIGECCTVILLLPIPLCAFGHDFGPPWFCTSQMWTMSGHLAFDSHFMQNKRHSTVLYLEEPSTNHLRLTIKCKFHSLHPGLANHLSHKLLAPGADSWGLCLLWEGKNNTEANLAHLHTSAFYKEHFSRWEEFWQNKRFHTVST